VSATSQQRPRPSGGQRVAFGFTRHRPPISGYRPQRRKSRITEPCTAKRSARFGAVDDARAGLDLGTANLNSTECSSFNARARFDRGTRSNEAATRELL
jgi:hypothetical protein